MIATGKLNLSAQMKSLIKLHSYKYLVGVLRTFIAVTEQISIANYSFYPKTQYQTLE